MTKRILTPLSWECEDARVGYMVEKILRHVITFSARKDPDGRPGFRVTASMKEFPGYSAGPDTADRETILNALVKTCERLQLNLPFDTTV